MYYNEQDGSFIEENTTIIFSFTTNNNLLQNRNIILNFINDFITETNQHTVAVEFDNSLYLLSAEAALVASII